MKLVQSLRIMCILASMELTGDLNLEYFEGVMIGLVQIIDLRMMKTKSILQCLGEDILAITLTL